MDPIHVDALRKNFEHLVKMDQTVLANKAYAKYLSDRSVLDIDQYEKAHSLIKESKTKGLTYMLNLFYGMSNEVYEFYLDFIEKQGQEWLKLKIEGDANENKGNGAALRGVQGSSQVGGETEDIRQSNVQPNQIAFIPDSTVTNVPQPTSGEPFNQNNFPPQNPIHLLHFPHLREEVHHTDGDAFCHPLHQNIITEGSTVMLRHDCDSLKGSSGSPVFCSTQEDETTEPVLRIVAQHNSGSGDRQNNTTRMPIILDALHTYLNILFPGELPKSPHQVVWAEKEDLAYETIKAIRTLGNCKFEPMDLSSMSNKMKLFYQSITFYRPWLIKV